MCPYKRQQRFQSLSNVVEVTVIPLTMFGDGEEKVREEVKNLIAEVNPYQCNPRLKFDNAVGK